MRNQELVDQYPYLYISEDRRAVWILRDGRDAEAMCFGAVSDQQLVNLNAEAEKAIQPGWFYCTRCRKAKPRSEFGYFYFAGKYCKDCQAADPDNYNKAMRETYE